nr:MAG: putative RNA-dependent RNA polymerase [Picobirnavirus sp.]
MMITKLNENIKKIVDQDNRIRHYLESLTVKVDFTPRSWAWDGKNGNPFLKPEQILSKWVEILQRKLLPNGDQISGADLDTLALTETEINSRVYQFDTAQIEKWGPQGGHAPMEELLDEIVLPSFKMGESTKKPEAFVANARKDSKNYYWRQAKAIVTRAFNQAVGKEVLRPASYKSVIDDMRARDTLESNSGLPMFARRNIPEVVAQAVSAAESSEWTLFPAIALFRTYNGKTRLVWMYPMSANLVEGSFFQPLQSAIMNARDVDIKFSCHTFSFRNFFSPWEGFDAVRRVVTEAYDQSVLIWPVGDESSYSFGCVAASDFSSTDEHFQRWSTLEVFDVIKTCFQRKYWDALKQSLMHMHSIPLVIGPDQMITGWHGVSSGSNWTNFVETVFDMIYSVYTALRIDNISQLTSGSKVSLVPLYAIGDDQAYLYGFDTDAALGDLIESNKYASEDIKHALSVCGEDVGQIVKEEKTTANAWQVKTLQRLFIRGYSREDGQLRGVYPTIRALKSSVFPERFHAPSKWSSDMYCARQFMILENCVDHPLFKEFVEFICSGNKHLIPFAKKSARELDAIQRKAKLIPGLNSTYNQEKRDESLAAFQSIRIAREL